MNCTIEGCTRPVGVHVWRLCRAHYEMARRQRFMSTARCAVTSCSKGAMHRGLCKAHYARLRRYGDPEASKPSPITKPIAFIENAVGHNDDDCLLWPYGLFNNGYGYVHISRKMLRAHRVVCERVYGAAPDEMVAAHSCGVRACVNPHHLRWATKKDNNADMITHGTRCVGEKNPKAKLTEADIRAIRASGMRQTDLALTYGVTQASVSAIQLRKCWRHVQ
jgi:hypothetical protein